MRRVHFCIVHKAQQLRKVSRVRPGSQKASAGSQLRRRSLEPLCRLQGSDSGQLRDVLKNRILISVIPRQAKSNIEPLGDFRLDHVHLSIEQSDLEQNNASLFAHSDGMPCVDTTIELTLSLS
jgi:hypothetical protein